MAVTGQAGEYQWFTPDEQSTVPCRKCGVTFRPMLQRGTSGWTCITCLADLTPATGFVVVSYTPSIDGSPLVAYRATFWDIHDSGALILFQGVEPIRSIANNQWRSVWVPTENQLSRIDIAE